MIINSGLHRTGSSSTQSILMQLRKYLLEYEVFYPRNFVQGNCSQLAQDLFLHKFELFEEILKEAKKSISSNGTILISAEDFENLLFEPIFIKNLLQRLSKNGIFGVRFVYVFRNQFQYFESLYSRLSIENWSNNYSYFDMGNIIINFKSFEVYDKRNKLFFAFDYNKAIENFRSIEEARMSCFEFNKFHKLFSGFELLRLCNIETADILDMYQNVDQSKIRLNNSISLDNIEFNYVCRFLGLQPTQENYLKNKEVFNGLIKARVEFRNKVGPDLKRSFQEVFSLIIQ